MHEEAYRKSAAEKGYDTPVEKTWEAGHFNDWHRHPFCLYVHVLDGEMTLELETPAGIRTAVCGPGDSIEVPIGLRHTERIGARPTRFLSAPRSSA
jgi:quercetin dioxygenase-like cupin family protein